MSRKAPLSTANLFKSAVALAFLALFSIGCEESRAGANLSRSDEERAKHIILSNRCGSCHTLQARELNLSGDIGPDLSRQGRRNRESKWLRKQLKNPHSVPDSEVTTGFEGKQKWMPRFDQLKDSDLDTLVHFLQSLE